jgi:hypothetical protein
MSSAARAKRDRERVKAEKAVKKKEDREANAILAAEEAAAAAALPGSGAKMSQADLIAALAGLHEKFERQAISFEDFDEQKQALIDQIAVS